MKEKTDKLKEKIEKDYKNMMAVINSISLPLFVEDTIEDMHILISNLIAENKELKEENLHWKGQYHLLSRKIDVIPKSKVVEELKKAISEEIDTSKAMFEGDFINGYIYALQSLLEKE